MNTKSLRVYWRKKNEMLKQVQHDRRVEMTIAGKDARIVKWRNSKTNRTDGTNMQMRRKKEGNI